MKLIFTFEINVDIQSVSPYYVLVIKQSNILKTNGSLCSYIPMFNVEEEMWEDVNKSSEKWLRRDVSI